MHKSHNDGDLIVYDILIIAKDETDIIKFKPITEKWFRVRDLEEHLIFWR